MYEKTSYHHYEKTPYQTQYKNYGKGAGLLSSLARSNTLPANDISFFPQQLVVSCTPLPTARYKSRTPSDTDPYIIDAVALQATLKLDDDLSADMCRTDSGSSRSGNASKSIMFYSIGWSRPTPSMALNMWAKHTGSEV